MESWTSFDGNAERSSGSVTYGRLIRQTNRLDLHLNDTKRTAQTSPAATPPAYVSGSFPLHRRVINEGEKRTPSPPPERQKNAICPHQSAPGEPKSKLREASKFGSCLFVYFSETRRRGVFTPRLRGAQREKQSSWHNSPNLSGA